MNRLFLISILLVSAQDSSLVRLLKGGKVPAERQGPVIDMIGRRGGAGDLAYLLGRVVDPEGFERSVRLRALDALADAVRQRKARPDGDLTSLLALVTDSALDSEVRVRAARLAGLWTVPGALEPLADLASAETTPTPLRAAAVEALAQLGEPARARLEALETDGRPLGVRILAVAALTRFDVATAADRAVTLLGAATDSDDLTPLIAAFVNRQGGPETLAAALSARRLAADRPSELCVRCTRWAAPMLRSSPP